MPLLALALLSGTPAGARAAAVDGVWSVLVITDKGTCDRAYRYSVEVRDGRVRFRGTESVNLSGSVDRSGRVQVSISRGGQSARGTGRLSDDSGSGTWTGRSPQQACSGRWEAERRG
jgi:hypothetical protein